MFSAIRFIVIWNLFIDINFFVLVYNFAIQDENQGTLDYKIVAIVTFLCIFSPYWITYSALLTIRNSVGSYAPDIMKSNSCMKRISKIIFLTFIGPLTTLVSQLIIGIGDILTIILTLLVCIDLKRVKAVKRRSESMAAWILDLDVSHLGNVNTLE